LGGHAPDEPEGEAAEETTLEFALEAHLRDFLAKNLGHIEPGLRLYEGNGRTGIEYPLEGGRIDLLAVDQSQKYVVIELKLSQGRNKALGQLLYYMGWVDQNLGERYLSWCDNCQRNRKRSRRRGFAGSWRYPLSVQDELRN
jgi:RecB family endonuclease NucS